MNSFQMKPSAPATLAELAALIRSRSARGPNSQRNAPPLLTKEQQATNKLITRIAEEFKWKASKLVLLTHHQHCDCGSDYRSVVGLFLECVHSTSKARRLRKPANLQEIDRLPHSKEEINEAIAICPHCLLERELTDALFNPVHDACVQLPMFDHTPQRRSCT